MFPALLAMAGCGETEQISRYSVRKEPVSDTTSLGDVQSLQAVPATAWFVKLTGPADAVAEVEDEFRSLVESTSVDGGPPKWTLPEGWSERPETGMRFATLTVEGTDPPLEASVIKLPYPGDRDSYLRDNINRWRGQVGLGPLSSGDWMSEGVAAGELTSIDAAGEDTTLVSISGRTEEIADARMLAAVILPEMEGTSSATLSGMTPPPSSDADSPITYEQPEEWQPGRTNTMRVAAFEVADDDGKVEITVIKAGGDVPSNVKRWRGQVELEPWTDEQLQEAAEELTVDGEVATYVSLVGEEQTILAAILPKGQQSWFFKLMGDSELARREEARFKTFVESVRFK